MVDTGSSFLWVLDGCLDHSECGKSPKFNPGASSTLKETAISFNIPYIDGYTSGHVAFDTVTLAGQTAEMAKFGELQLSDAQPRQGCRASRRSPQRRPLALEPRFGLALHSASFHAFPRILVPASCTSHISHLISQR